MKLDNTNFPPTYIDSVSADNKLTAILDFDACKELVNKAIRDGETYVILCPHYSINISSKYEEGESLQFDLDELGDYLGQSVSVSDYDDLVVDMVSDECDTKILVYEIDKINKIDANPDATINIHFADGSVFTAPYVNFNHEEQPEPTVMNTILITGSACPLQGNENGKTEYYVNIWASPAGQSLELITSKIMILGGYSELWVMVKSCVISYYGNDQFADGLYTLFFDHLVIV